ncbi:MAG: xanthine dehydrogenase family protein molybdopterin-binding subunit [Ardenticatenaceae bacterium]|nr:xanthine dehydrogenase family protein molybdopterin-binding subunit [Ardenticatenaceae bacterium]
MSSEAKNEYRWIGKNMKRVEDPRLLTGRGKYIDDIHLPGMAEAAVMRSPYAHARILSIDTSKAEALPGVICVLTGKQAAEQTGPTACFANPPVTQYVIAVDKVRHVGEAVAAVVAEDRYIAEDAIDLIEVEYDPLPVVVNAEEAIHSTGDAVLHPERGDTNVALERVLDFGPVDEDFANADLIVQRHLYWPRSGGQPMETCGAVAEFDEGMGKFTVYSNGSMYNYVGWLCAVSLGVAATQLNIVPTIAGGSFGSKLFTHKVVTLTCTLARAAGCPVKYIEDRLDNTMSCDNHGSDRTYDAELAVMKDGTVKSIRYRCLDDYGAYLQFGVGHHGNAAAQVTGPYTINSVRMHLVAVMTNKGQQGAYRGFGSEVTNFVLERLMDAAADELGIDPLEIRRKNFIKPEQFPYKIPTGNVYDSGNYEAVLDEALTLLDYEGWRQKQAEARREGRYIGIGTVTAQERSVFSSTEFWFWNHEPGFALTSSPESIGIKIDPTGKAFVTLHAPFWGNSPETMATQIVAEQLTMDPADIIVNYTDTDHGLNGTGPGGSRFTVMVAGAIGGATKEIKRKLYQVAGHLMEVAEEDLELVDGKVQVKGAPDKFMSIADIAMQSHFFRLSLPDDFNSGLDATYVYDHPYTTMPSEDRSDLGVFYPIMGHMCHMPVVEVDIETGRVEFLDYVAVHDCGTMVNPMTLAGHVRGGTAQGIGSALYEEFAYDENGQLITASYADYLIPTVHEVPADVRVGHVETPSPFTEFGIKGGGEGGRMGAPPALASAIEDALRPLGIKIDALPVTPNKLRGLIREAQEV